MDGCWEGGVTRLRQEVEKWCGFICDRMLKTTCPQSLTSRPDLTHGDSPGVARGPGPQSPPIWQANQPPCLPAGLPASKPGIQHSKILWGINKGGYTRVGTCGSDVTCRWPTVHPGLPGNQAVGALYIFGQPARRTWPRALSGYLAITTNLTGAASMKKSVDKGKKPEGKH